MQIEGLSMRGEQRRRDRLRQEALALEAATYPIGDRISDAELREIADRWENVPRVVAGLDAQGEAWSNAFLAWSKTREGDAPAWEDFGEK